MLGLGEERSCKTAMVPAMAVWRHVGGDKAHGRQIWRWGGARAKLVVPGRKGSSDEARGAATRSTGDGSVGPGSRGWQAKGRGRIRRWAVKERGGLGGRGGSGGREWRGGRSYGREGCGRRILRPRGAWITDLQPGGARAEGIGGDSGVD